MAGLLRSMRSRKTREFIRPVHGPYGVCQETEDGFRCSLTEDGKRIVADILERYPNPVALLRSTYPKTYFMAKKVAKISDEEINSACMEGIMWGVFRCQPERANLNTAISWSLRGTVHDHVRAIVGNPDRQARPMVFSMNGFPDPVETRSPPESTIEFTALTAGANLSDRERWVIEQVYVKGWKYTQVAEVLEISRERARQIHNFALGKLRDKLKQQGVEQP
jgi:RNA polymerase sigma factor (sigma-70 family)